MVDKKTLDQLEKDGLIDQRFLLWWQLGHEGRRVLSEEEFERGLTKISYESGGNFTEDQEVKQRDFRFWTGDDVPILAKQVDSQKFRGVPAFVTVKPLLHFNPTVNALNAFGVFFGCLAEGYKGNLDYEPPPLINPELSSDLRSRLEFNVKGKLALSVYEEPHIRGVIAEVTDEFVFWFPITFGEEPGAYSNSYTKFRGVSETIVIDSIHPTKFWENLIKEEWSKGRRAQRKPSTFNLEENGFSVVPYYSFEPDKSHVMIYPCNLFDRGLDIPIVVRGDPSTRTPRIIGAGYLRFSDPILAGSTEVYGEKVEWGAEEGWQTINYWELNKSLKEKAKESIKRRLGLEGIF